MKLSENTILITGGSAGIGLEIAKQLLEKGNKVIITGRNEQRLQKAKEQLKGVNIIQSDAGNPDEIEKLREQVSKDFPYLNVVINNAGVMLKVNLQNHKHSPLELTKEIDINLKGPIWMTDAFLPLLKKQNSAAIVNVSSGLAYVPLPIATIYCATKAGLHSYCVSLREQLRNTKVKVFELAPPFTDTDMKDAFLEADLKGISAMLPQDMVATFLKSFSRDEYEIAPGQSKQLKFMGRFFPNFILKQLSKNLDLMHAS